MTGPERRRAVARRVRRVLRRAGLARPRLGIAVLAETAEAGDLDATLHALRAIPDAGLSVVVPAATLDTATRRVAERHAAADWRVTVGAGDLRSAAAVADALASRYAVVLRAGDEPAPGSLAAAVAALAHSGAAWATGPGLAATDRSAAVFGADLLRALGDVPVEQLPAAALARDSDPVVLAAAAARPRPSSTVTGLADTRPRLSAAITGMRAATDMVPESWRASWAAGLVAGELAPFVDDVERFSDAEWALLHEEARRLRELAAGRLEVVPVETRVKAWLAAEGLRSELVDFVAARRFESGQFATRAANGRVRAVLPVPDGVPPDLLVLADSETALRTSVRRLWLDGDDVHLQLFAYVAGVDLVAAEPDIRVTFVDAGGARVEAPVDVSSDREVTRFAGSHHVNHDRGVVGVVVPVADLLGGSRWRVEVGVHVAGLTRTGVVDHADRTGSVGGFGPVVRGRQALGVGPGPFALVVGPSVTAVPLRGPVVTDVALTDDGLVVTTTDPGSLTLAGPAGRLPGSAGTGSVGWSLRHDPWGLGERPVPPGRYALSATGGPVAPAPELVARLPLTVLTRHHRATVRLDERPGGAALLVELGPPLADDEVGPYCQRRLQEWYADPDAHALEDDLVYLQAYTGATATDSPRAIADELARARPDLRRVWAVADAGSFVPEGAETVLWRSRAWYAALARARHVVTNIELEAWFRRRPGQGVLQTFHGYPSKAMGIGLWHSKNFTPSRIERQLDRTSRNWTLLLTPSPDMNRYYRENYRYDGDILDAGYPRDDVLVTGDAAVRAATRARLGIEEGTVAVLYAPTWRDDQATGFRSAPMVDHLGVEAAAAQLGPGFALLLRGHRFMDPPRVGGAGARIVDVTGYPEVNDLILAADAAVLDYSSMRFDVALTGIPMVFLVPDLATYATVKRGFLYPFEPTAPGPLLATRDEVVAALRDLDGVRRGHATAYAAFNREYNAFQDGRAARRAVERFFVG